MSLLYIGVETIDLKEIVMIVNSQSDNTHTHTYTHAHAYTHTHARTHTNTSFSSSALQSQFWCLQAQQHGCCEQTTQAVAAIVDLIHSLRTRFYD